MESPLEAFSGRITPTRVPFIYQAGLGVVALAMILLPMIYIALIVAMGALVWWHLVTNVGLLSGHQSRAIVLALLAYLGPAVAGGVFVLFLIKPLFSRAPKPPPAFKIEEGVEPLLFAFVKKICGLVGAPVPKEIRIDTQVNASAGFRRGWWSFFGNDLVLVIGLPLVAGMSMRQVAGVLAHEFGHFAQGAGMRFSYIIRSVNAWFARVVYERDHWDQKLEGWAQAEHWGIKAVFVVAKGGVWLGRKVLWCLMQAGHALSCFMSRQMEFDADSYEAKIAGSSEFARTAERLRLLHASHGAAMQDAWQTYQSRELPDDLAALVLWRERVMPKATREALTQDGSERKTAWNDTHPADGERVKAAAEWQAEGVFQLEAPAEALFSDFRAISQAVTRHYFLRELGVPASQVRFRETTEIMQDRESAESSDKQLDLFYENHFHVLRLAPVELRSPSRHAEAVQQMSSHAGRYQAYLERYHSLQGRITDQSVGADLLRAQFSLSAPAEFGLESSSVTAAEAAMARTQGEINHLVSQMQGYESAATARLGAALGSWRARHAQSEPERALQLERWLTAQQALARMIPEMIFVHRARRALELMMNNSGNHNDVETLERQMREVGLRIEATVNRLLTVLTEVPHPYLAGHPAIAASVHRPGPDDNEWSRPMKLADVCIDALIPLLVRLMGDLCGLALESEKEPALPLAAQDAWSDPGPTARPITEVPPEETSPVRPSHLMNLPPPSTSQE